MQGMSDYSRRLAKAGRPTPSRPRDTVTHLLDPYATKKGGPAVTVCGNRTGNFTNSPDRVSCPRCFKVFNKMYRGNRKGRW